MAINFNPNATIRHQWTKDNVCKCCGAMRQVVRWKELDGKRLWYRHKMYYSLDNWKTFIERPDCVVKSMDRGKLTEADFGIINPSIG